MCTLNVNTAHQPPLITHSKCTMQSVHCVVMQTNIKHYTQCTMYSEQCLLNTVHQCNPQYNEHSNPLSPLNAQLTTHNVNVQCTIQFTVSTLTQTSVNCALWCALCSVTLQQLQLFQRFGLIWIWNAI